MDIRYEFRGRDFGFRAMSAAEARAKELGAEEMGLHVFAGNEAAMRTYEKSGYKATSIVMSKRLCEKEETPGEIRARCGFYVLRITRRFWREPCRGG